MKSRRTSNIRVPLAGFVLFGSLAWLAAGPAQTAKAVTVEIPVRVLDGTRFVDDLTLGDFEILEEGFPIAPESLALVKGRAIARREGLDTPPPATSRTYYLMFQTVEWDPKLGEAIDRLFLSVLQPGDAMTLVTPVKSYALQKDAIGRKSPGQLAKAMKDILKQDIQRGGGQYREVTRDLSRLTRSISNTQPGGRVGVEDIETDFETEASMGFGLEQQIDHYRNALMSLESLRLVDEKKLLSFADLLGSVPGPKTVYLFYAREFRPEISPNALQALMSLYQDNPNIVGNLMDLFQMYKHETSFNAEIVKRAFVDAGIVFHFIFMDKKSKRLFGATMREQSEDIFPGFRDIAAATGGLTEISQNPAASFARASSASEDYYLLTYIPPASAAAPGFRRIAVIIKKGAGKYTVLSRSGYTAR